MKDKNILIVGASSGIGKATTQAMGQLGNNLYLVARREEYLQDLEQQISAVKKYWAYDIRETGHIKEIFESLQLEKIKLDGLIYCTGKTYTSPVHLHDDVRFCDMMETNVNPFLEITKYFFSKKYSNEGSVVTALSSISALIPEKGQGDYAATKGALNAVVPIMAKEGLNRKIRVNVISPSFVATEIYERQKRVFDVDSYIEQNQPFGLIEPENIAQVICFLHSDAGKYITGQNIVINAGMM